MMMEKYERVKKIGEGSFGKALLVRRKNDRRQCVIKEINIARMSPKEKEESRKEVKVLSQLKHPNIVTYQESFEEFGNLMIVMDYCEGGDLYEKIVNQKGVHFTESQVLDYFVQICLGLKHIHDRKILHRDLKSQNIFLTKHGIVKLGDFGIARVLKNTMELARTCIGTPYYLSPEICENRPYNNKSDIWSLGCVLYELCTLKHAFESGNMKNLVLKIIRGSYPPLPNRYTPDMRCLVAQCFKRSPSDRPSVNTILRRPFIQDRIRKFLSPEVIEEEFSHTVIHRQKPMFAKPAPGGDRPPSQGAKRAMDPAAVYGVSVAKKPVQPKKAMQPPVKKPLVPAVRKSSGDSQSQVRISAEKRKDMEARERRRKNMIANQEQAYQDYVKKLQKQRWEKQQLDQINKAREGGWKQLLSSNDNSIEKKKPDVKGNKQEIVNKHGKQMEKYQPKKEDSKAVKEQASEIPAKQEQAPSVGVSAPEKPVKGVLEAAMQGKEAGEKGGEAAQRARLVEEFWQRKREAALNKARGKQEVGPYAPKPYARKPAVQAGNIAEPSGINRQAAGPMAKNQQEQAYLKQLEAIRKQNFYDRLNLQNRNHLAQPQQVHQPQAQPKPSIYNVGDPRYDPEARRKKINALKEQADHRAAMLREQLDKRRKVLQDRLQQDRISRQREKENRDQHVEKLQEIVNKGQVKEKPVAPLKVPNMEVPAVGIDTVMGQMDKVKLFRSCSEGDLQEIKRVNIDVSKARRQWGAGAISPIAALPLEMTASEMEATSVSDSVVKLQDQKKDPRKCWKPDGKTQLVSLLHQANIADNTVGGTLITTERTYTSQTPASSQESMQTENTRAKGGEKRPAQAFVVDLEGNTIEEEHSKDLPSEESAPNVPTGRTKGETYRIPSAGSRSRDFGDTVVRRPLPPRPVLSDEEDEKASVAIKSNNEKVDVKTAWQEDPNKSSKDVKSNDTSKGKLFTPGRKAKTSSKEDAMKIVDIGEEDESFHTPKESLLETRSRGLKTGCYDVDKRILRTCSLPDLTKLSQAIEEVSLEEENNSDNGSQKDSTTDSSDSLADDEGGEEDDEEGSASSRGMPVRDNPSRRNGTDTGDAEDEAEDDDSSSVNEEEEEERQDLENMLNSLRHVLNSSAGKTPPSTSQREDRPESKEPTGDERVRGSIFEDWDSDEDDEGTEAEAAKTVKDEKRMKNKENLFQRIEESRQALEEELGTEKFLKVYKYIQAMQENDNDELNVSIGPENEVMDLLGPDKEHLYQKVLYLVMADAAYFEDND